VNGAIGVGQSGVTLGFELRSEKDSSSWGARREKTIGTLSHFRGSAPCDMALTYRNSVLRLADGAIGSIKYHFPIGSVQVIMGA